MIKMNLIVFISLMAYWFGLIACITSNEHRGYVMERLEKGSKAYLATFAWPCKSVVYNKEFNLMGCLATVYDQIGLHHPVMVYTGSSCIHCSVEVESQGALNMSQLEGEVFFVKGEKI